MKTLTVMVTLITLALAAEAEEIHLVCTYSEKGVSVTLEQSFNMPQNSRRSFIKDLSVGLGAFSIANALPDLAAAATPKTPRKLGLALVGLGNYATKQLAPALETATDCYLAGIVTGTKKKESVWREKYGIKKANIYNYENFDSIAS